MKKQKSKIRKVIKGKNGVTIFGRPIVDSKTGKPITKEDMKDKK